jgi:tetratricopeptide (TPR) repeat protein
VSRESLVFGIAGTFFGLLIGWMLGSQQQAAPIAASAAAAAAPSSQTSAAPSPPPVDVQRAANLERTANAQPANAAVRTELANLYFDAERFDLAIPWYEAVLKLDPKSVTVSTDLGVCYYYTNQIDRALAQLDHSLAIDPRHAKTLLNQGIVRAWGKQDMVGASQSWRRVLEVAPDSEEAQRAKQALDGLKSAHPNVGSGGPPDSGGAGSSSPERLPTEK